MKYVFEFASQLAAFREDLIDYFPLALRARRTEQIYGSFPMNNAEERKSVSFRESQARNVFVAA